jgi:hypothetical protein
MLNFREDRGVEPSSEDISRIELEVKVKVPTAYWAKARLTIDLAEAERPIRFTVEEGYIQCRPLSAIPSISIRRLMTDTTYRNG